MGRATHFYVNVTFEDETSKRFKINAHNHRKAVWHVVHTECGRDDIRRLTVSEPIAIRQANREKDSNRKAAQRERRKREQEEKYSWYSGTTRLDSDPTS